MCCRGEQRWAATSGEKKTHFGAASRGNLVTPCKAEQRIQANLFRPKLFPFHFEHWVLSSEASLFCGSCEVKFYGNIQMHTFIPTNQIETALVDKSDRDLDVPHRNGPSAFCFSRNVKTLILHLSQHRPATQHTTKTVTNLLRRVTMTCKACKTSDNTLRANEMVCA